MACPDRMNDARILAEVERRKLMAKPADPQKQSDVMTHTWEGDIRDILHLFPQTDKITWIEKTGENQYTAKIEL